MKAGSKKYDLGQLRGAWKAGYEKGIDGNNKQIAVNLNDVNKAIEEKYFHILEQGKVTYQGYVNKALTNNRFLVTYFDWFFGEPATKYIKNINEMKDWIFYDTAYEMRLAFAHLMEQPPEEFERQEKIIKFLGRR